MISFQGCEVQIEKSVIVVTVQHHQACLAIPASSSLSCDTKQWTQVTNLQFFLYALHTHERYFLLYIF